MKKQQEVDSVKHAEQEKVVQARFEKQEVENKKQKIVAWALAAGLLLCIAVAFLVFRGYREKKRANEEIYRQKLLVAEKNEEILSSIRYAKRIQNALLPSEKYMNKNLERLKK